MKNNYDIKTNYIYDINNMDFEININDFKIHPIYTKYASNKEGDILNLSKNKLVLMPLNNKGYKYVNIYFNSKQKNYYAHRFIWECYNGIIPDKKIIDHINNIKTDNRLENLQCITSSQNSKESTINRDKLYYQNVRKNNKFIKSTCIDDGKIDFYHSIYLAEKNLGICRGEISIICNNKYKYHKTATSKINNKKYMFEIIDKLPDNYMYPKKIVIKKMSEEEKLNKIKEINNKIWNCPNCNKCLKYKSKTYHIKICN